VWGVGVVPCLSFTNDGAYLRAIYGAGEKNLQPPKIPYVSNVTGTWITAKEATDPSYGLHLRSSVRFEQGLRELLKEPERVLEVGPH